MLAGLAVRAAGAQWAAERVSKVAIATFEEAPAPALQLMRLAPHPSYGEVLRAHPERLRADPESALEVLLADAPDAEAAALVRALSTGLESAMDSVLETLASAGLSTGPDDV